mgnify:CR=1 FL=1
MSETSPKTLTQKRIKTGGQTFTVLHVDVSTGKGRPLSIEGRAELVGGQGLAAALFERFHGTETPALDPAQPLIFAVGPLTGYFPLMSKVICGFLPTGTGYPHRRTADLSPWDRYCARRPRAAWSS